jgi:hypothetical protein
METNISKSWNAEGVVRVMSKRKFSRPPQIGSHARPAGRVDADSLPPEVEEFKQTYITERRLLERFRNPEATPYTPAASLDGKSMFDSPEERSKENQWLLAYKKLCKLQDVTAPTFFVRVLFKVLRSSSLAVPTVQQLASPGMVDLVVECVKALPVELRAQFISETQRATSAIRLHQKLGSSSFPLAVYYAIVDFRLGLSPLFKYCLAVTTVEKVQKNNDDSVHCGKLENLAKQYEFLALLDYTLFQDSYNEIWQDAIPERLRVAAKSFMATALGQ